MRAFLSHAGRDKADVKKLWKLVKLNFQGELEEFLDEYHLEWGEGLEKNIESEISESDCFLLFLSNESIESVWVSKEFQIALEKEKLLDRIFIYPVLLDDIWHLIAKKPFGKTWEGEERLHLILKDRTEEDYEGLAKKISNHFVKFRERKLSRLSNQVSELEEIICKGEMKTPPGSSPIGRRIILAVAAYGIFPLSGYSLAHFFPYPQTTKKANLKFSLSKDAGYNGEATWQSFRLHLETQLDKHLEEWSDDYKSNSEVNMATLPDSKILWMMKMRQIEMAWIGTGTSIRAIRDAGSPYTPSLVPVNVTTNQTVKYRAVFIKHSGKFPDVTTLIQMGELLRSSEEDASFGLKKGSSNSGNSIPRIVLNSLGVTGIIEEAEGHEELISKVNSGEYTFACVASDILEMSRRNNKSIVGDIVNLDLPQEGDFEPDVLSIVTDEYPSATLGWRSSLPPILKKSIESSFNTFEGKLDHLYPEEITFRPIANFFDEYGKVVRVQERADAL